jgi:hypothetical protein
MNIVIEYPNSHGSFIRKSISLIRWHNHVEQPCEPSEFTLLDTNLNWLICRLGGYVHRFLNYFRRRTFMKESLQSGCKLLDDQSREIGRIWSKLLCELVEEKWEGRKENDTRFMRFHPLYLFRNTAIA